MGNFKKKNRSMMKNFGVGGKQNKNQNRSAGEEEDVKKGKLEAKKNRNRTEEEVDVDVDVDDSVHEYLEEKSSIPTNRKFLKSGVGK